MPRSRQFGLFLALLLAVSVLNFGCPQPMTPDPDPEPMLSVDNRELEFSATDSNLAFSIDTGGDTFQWTISADRPWLMLSSTSGTGPADIMVTIDRSQLDPSTAGTGTITVRAGNQTITVEINAVSAFTPIDTAYFPMAVGNSWTFGLPDIPPVFKQNRFSTAGLSLTVADTFAEQGFEIWQVDMAIENISVTSTMLKGLGIGAIGGGEMSLSTYWVKVDGTWYIGFGRDELATLPNTNAMLPLAALLELPGTLAYVESTGLLDMALEEIRAIQTATREAQSENSEALSTHLSDALANNYESLFALATAFGEAFDTYDNSDPLANAVVELIADVSKGLEPLINFGLEALTILLDTQQRLFLLENTTPSVDYWMAWEAEFGNYTSDDPKVQALVPFLSRTALELAVLNEASGSYTEDDAQAVAQYQLELNYAVSDALGMVMSDPASLVTALTTYVESYETENAAVQANIDATLRILADLGATLELLEGNTVFPLDPAGWIQFVADGQAFNRSYFMGAPLNPSALQMAIILDGASEFLDAFAIVAPTVNAIASDLFAIETVITTDGLSSFTLDGVHTVLVDFAAFFGEYAETNNDALATEFNIILSGRADEMMVVLEFRDAVATIPFEDTAGSLSTLLPDVPYAYTLEDFGIGDQGDCISPRVIVETEDATLHIASTIYARDVGPVMLSFFPLQYGTVGGATIGTPPAP